jgi:hypothetical protein
MIRHRKPIGIGDQQQNDRKAKLQTPPPEGRRSRELWMPRVTICIAGYTPAGDGVAIAAVTDRMMSFRDEFPAAEGVMDKDWRLNWQWGCLFAGDTAYFDPLAQKVSKYLRQSFDDDNNIDDAYELGVAVASGYQDLRSKIFIQLHLAQYGIKTMEDFRELGLATLARI